MLFSFSPALRRVPTLALGVFAATAVACAPAADSGSDPDPESPSEPTTLLSILDTAEADGRFTTLLDAVESANLSDTLNGDGPFTVFAPTDDAFAAMDQDVLAAALADPNGLLAQVLTYHVVDGEVPAADVISLSAATTLEGSDISIEVIDGNVILNGNSQVVTTDINCTNGLIHVIDTVLLPPAEEEPELEDIVDIAVNDGRFTTLVSALTAANLVDTLKGEGPFTVFAPTDDAFGAMDQDVLAAALADPDGLLTQVLTYHVVSGAVSASEVVNLNAATTLEGSDISIEVVDGNVILNGDTQVIITDIQASNGIIHVIDSVLLPPAEEEPAPEDIVDIAVNDGRFTTLVTALTAAQLVDTLKGEGPFTVFAPTDDAFAAMDQDVLAAALADPNGLLTQVLTYHVVSGAVSASEVVNLNAATTLEGSDISIQVVDGNVILNGNTQVIITDIQASNGIIHVIDSVLLPPAEEPAPLDIVDTAIADGRFTTLVTALTAAQLVDTLKGEGPFTVFAPTDDAFAAMDQDVLAAALADPNGLLTEVLLYHVVSASVPAADVVNLSSTLTVDGRLVTIEVVDGNVILNGNAQVIITDIETANGIIHVIDTVLLPPQVDIVDTAIADGRFTTLVSALTAANLVETLRGDGPFTVFAPTDDAFAAMDQSVLAAALADPNGLLTQVLTYHVVGGSSAVSADIVTSLSSATTLQGGDVSVTVNGGSVFLNTDIEIIITDIPCKNGIIHVIDGVLLPPAGN